MPIIPFWGSLFQLYTHWKPGRKLRKDTRGQRKFGIRLSKDVPGYWVFSDVKEFKDKTITISYPQSGAGFDAIYESDQIEGFEV